MACTGKSHVHVVGLELDHCCFSDNWDSRDRCAVGTP